MYISTFKELRLRWILRKLNKEQKEIIALAGHHIADGKLQLDTIFPKLNISREGSEETIVYDWMIQLENKNIVAYHNDTFYLTYLGRELCEQIGFMSFMGKVRERARNLH